MLVGVVELVDDVLDSPEVGTVLDDDGVDDGDVADCGAVDCALDPFVGGAVVSALFAPGDVAAVDGDGVGVAVGFDLGFGEESLPRS